MKGAGHQWIDSAPTEIPAWIEAHSPTYRNRNHSQPHAANTTATAAINAQTDAQTEAEVEVYASEGPGPEQLDVIPVKFDLSKSGLCLRAATVAPGGAVMAMPCGEAFTGVKGAEGVTTAAKRGMEWVRWTHGAIAHSSNTSLCLTIKPQPGYSAQGSAGTGNGLAPVSCGEKAMPLQLEPCFRHKSIMNNYFKVRTVDVYSRTLGVYSCAHIYIVCVHCVWSTTRISHGYIPLLTSPLNDMTTALPFPDFPIRPSTSLTNGNGMVYTPQHDLTDEGTLLSGVCSGMCISLSAKAEEGTKKKKVYVDECRNPASIGWAMRSFPGPPPPPRTTH